MRQSTAFWTALILLLSACGNPPPPANAETTASAAEHIGLADGDGDGRLTLDEFRAFVALEAEDDIGRSRMIERFGRHAQAFERLDADADQTVTLEEIVAARAEANAD